MTSEERESTGQGEGVGDSLGHQVSMEEEKSGSTTVPWVGGGALAIGAASSCTGEQKGEAAHWEAKES
jgi:hypothetical protein